MCGGGGVEVDCATRKDGAVGVVSNATGAKTNRASLISEVVTYAVANNNKKECVIFCLNFEEER